MERPKNKKLCTEMNLQGYSFLYKWVQTIFPWAICEVKDNPDRIYLTFDDGPHPQQTPQILDILGKYEVKASFLVVGCRSEKNPHLLEQIMAAGHAIGNHSYTHRHFWGRSTEELEKEILVTEDIIWRHTGIRTRYFRPPHGLFTPAARSILEKHHYKLLLWNVLTGDYRRHYSAEKILQRTLGAIGHGSILLLHDYNSKNNNTIQVLPELIQRLQMQGFQFGTIYEICTIT